MTLSWKRWFMVPVDQRMAELTWDDTEMALVNKIFPNLHDRTQSLEREVIIQNTGDEV